MDEKVKQQIQSMLRLVRAGVALLPGLALIAVVVDWATGQGWSLIAEVLMIYALGLVIVFANVRLFQPFFPFKGTGPGGTAKQQIQSMLRLVRASVALLPALVLTTVIADWANDQGWPLIAEILVTYALGLVAFLANVYLFQLLFQVREGDGAETVAQKVQSVLQISRIVVALLPALVLTAIAADWATGQGWPLLAEVLVIYALGLAIFFVNIRLFQPFFRLKKEEASS